MTRLISILYTCNNKIIISNCSKIFCKLLFIHQGDIFIHCDIRYTLITIISEWTKELGQYQILRENLNPYDGILHSLQILSMMDNRQSLHEFQANDFISILNDWINDWFVDLPVSTTFIELWELVSEILCNLLLYGHEITYNSNEYALVIDIVYHLLRSVFMAIPTNHKILAEKVKIYCCKVVYEIINTHQCDGIIDCITQNNDLYVLKQLIKEMSCPKTEQDCNDKLRHAVIDLFHVIIYEHDEDELAILIDDCEFINEIKSSLNLKVLSQNQQYGVFTILSNIICHQSFAEIVMNDHELMSIIIDGLESTNFHEIRDGAIYCINNLLHCDQMRHLFLFNGKKMIKSFCTSLKLLNESVNKKHLNIMETNNSDYGKLIENIANVLVQKFTGQDQLNVLKSVGEQLTKSKFISIYDNILSNRSKYMMDALGKSIKHLKFLRVIACGEWKAKSMNEWNNYLNEDKVREEDDLWKILGRTRPQKEADEFWKIMDVSQY